MSEWKEVKLKDVCKKITVGHVGSMAKQYREKGIPFLRSLNIKAFRLNLNNLKYVNMAFHSKLKKSSLEPGDVAVVRTGYPGTACVIPISLGMANCSDLVIIRPGEELNPHYLAAIFNSSFGKQLVSGSLVGVAQQHFNVTVAKEMKIKLPNREIQNKIAAILSAYDDLIENNNRRIALLEQMAEEIYREWFVRMRFPGYEDAVFHKGVPEGWASKPSSSVLDVLSGGTPKTKVSSYWDGDIPFFTPKDVSHSFYVTDTQKHISLAGLRNCSSRLYKKNTIFITARGTVGKVALSAVDMAMNQSCYALIPKNDEQSIYFYFLAIQNSVKYIKGVSKSGVFDNIIVDTFKIVPLLIPPDLLIKEFNEKVRAIFEHILNLLYTTSTLKQTRDKLLSRLISGKLSVEELDIAFPASQ